jgi:hypothetical protein
MTQAMSKWIVFILMTIHSKITGPDMNYPYFCPYWENHPYSLYHINSDWLVQPFQSEWWPCFLFLFIARLLLVRLTQNQVQMKENYIWDKVGQFLRAFLSNIGWDRGLRNAPPPLSIANQVTFLFKHPPATSQEQQREWNQRGCKGQPTLLSIGPPASPKPNLWKLTERLFSTHSWRRPPKQWPIWPVQDATDHERLTPLH